jgi:hypothetical protein
VQRLVVISFLFSWGYAPHTHSFFFLDKKETKKSRADDSVAPKLRYWIATQPKPLRFRIACTAYLFIQHLVCLATLSKAQGNVTQDRLFSQRVQWLF